MATVRNARRRERRGTAAEWAAVNPILKAGELGILQDGDGQVQEIRVGDGTSAWADLGDTALLPKSVLTAAYAALVDGKVDPDQLPDIDALPAGGDTGDALVKASGDDGDAEWVDLSGIYVQKAAVAGYRETLTTLGTSGTVTLDFAASNAWYIAPTGAVTIAFDNLPAAGTVAPGTLIVANSNFAITWPVGTKFPGGAAPELDGETFLSLVARSTEVTVGTAWSAVA